MLSTIYILLLGLLSACFIEVGIQTFLPAVESDWDGVRYEGDEPHELREKRKVQHGEYKLKSEKRATIHYVLSLAGSTILSIIALLYQRPLGVLGQGVLLGGVFNLASGTFFGITGGGRLARFAVATVSLLVALALGWWVFLPHTSAF